MTLSSYFFVTGIQVGGFPGLVKILKQKTGACAVHLLLLPGHLNFVQIFGAEYIRQNGDRINDFSCNEKKSGLKKKSVHVLLSNQYSNITRRRRLIK